MAKITLALALVLVDMPQHNLKCGQLVEAGPDLIKQLQAAGGVDPHKNAVKHAQSVAAPLIRLEAPPKPPAPAPAPARAPASVQTSAIDPAGDDPADPATGEG